MIELVEWLEQQLDADERMARAALESHSIKNPDHERFGESQWPRPRVIAVYQEQVNVFRGGLEFIRQQSPAHALADIAVKRRLLGDENDGAALYAVHERGYWRDEITRWADEIIRLLAQPYKDRPGYREEWQVG